ncbi:hypothetical protein HWV62_21078 [Athelia sp. TMB]|nr:hypothetical protein HWV62_21078 [Athelia sp. TMB]
MLSFKWLSLSIVHALYRSSTLWVGHGESLPLFGLVYRSGAVIDNGLSDISGQIMQSSAAKLISTAYIKPTVSAVVIWANKTEDHKCCVRTELQESFSDSDTHEVERMLGGGQAYTFRETEFIEYMVADYADRVDEDDDTVYSYHAHVSTASAGLMCEAHTNLIPLIMPLDVLALKLTTGQLLSAVKFHNMTFSKNKIHMDSMREALRGHECSSCADAVTLIKPARKAAVRADFDAPDTTNKINPKGKRVPHKKIRGRKKEAEVHWVDGRVKHSKTRGKFPPRPPTDREREEIIRNFCDAQLPEEFEEVGCAVCGQLVKRSVSESLEDVNFDEALLHGIPGSTRKERTRSSQPIEETEGPILARSCTHICNDCLGFLEKDRVPMNALANGLWLGDVPAALQGITYAEKVLIARARHNRCVVKVQSGMWKMQANAVSFSNPIHSVYNTLPPSIAAVEEVLAFIYIGHVQPEEDDLKKTPMVVRRSKVTAALEWLKLNNEFYADLNISYTNLAEYPEHGCPFVYDFYKQQEVRDVDALAANDNKEEIGTAEGECPFVVHGLVESDLVPDSGKSWKELKAIAVRHLAEGGHVMAVGHSNMALTTIKNPGLYPQMFPWLFPYGKGGLDQPQHKHIIASAVRKRWLLQYHDKSHLYYIPCDPIVRPMVPNLR